MYRRYLAWYGAISLLLLVVGPIGVTYAVDPLQFFRRAWYPAKLSANERYQNPGLARHYDYDTVVIGTSMTQNFYPSHVNRTLGVRALKLSISGATAHEQYLLLRVALRTGKVKRVIWGIDDWVFRGAPDRVRSDLGAFPFYLYEDNPIGSLRYLVNWSAFSDALAILADRQRWGQPAGGDVPDDWDTFDQYYRFGRDRALADYFSPLNIAATATALRLNDYDLDAMRASLRENMVALVEQYPEVEFDLFFPPYSILKAKFYAVHFPMLLDAMLQIDGEIAAQLVREPNIRLFAFQDVAEITEDLDRYKDMGHFDVGVNRYIIESIAVGRHRVGLSDPTAPMRRLREQVAAFPAPQKPLAISARP